MMHVSERENCSADPCACYYLTLVNCTYKWVDKKHPALIIGVMRLSIALLSGAALLVGAGSIRAFDDENKSIIANLSASPSISVSTLPPSGDVNPYGAAVVT